MGLILIHIFVSRKNFTFYRIGIVKASSSSILPSSDDDKILDEILEDGEAKSNSQGNSVLAKLAIAVGIAASITVILICFKGPSVGSSWRFMSPFDGSSPLISSGSPVGYTLSIFGCQVVLPEYTPGYGVEFFLFLLIQN